jgi:uncharacterized membrane protein
MDIKSLFADEKVQLKKLEELVESSINEEKLLSSRLLDLENDPKIGFGQKLADRVADFGGSWAFILLFFAIITVWIGVNLLAIGKANWDPYPFILLNLVLSCTAALQAPIIMMSQNRQEEKDRRRARGDFLINMKAEMEVRNLHGKVDLLLTEQMQSLFRVQEAQLVLLNEISQKLEAVSGQKIQTSV